VTDTHTHTHTHRHTTTAYTALSKASRGKKTSDVRSYRNEKLWASHWNKRRDLKFGAQVDRSNSQFLDDKTKINQNFM